MIDNVLYALLPHPLISYPPYTQDIDLGFRDPPSVVDEFWGHTRERFLARSVRPLVSVPGHGGPERASRGGVRSGQIWRGRFSSLARCCAVSSTDWRGRGGDWSSPLDHIVVVELLILVVAAVVAAIIGLVGLDALVRADVLEIGVDGLLLPPPRFGQRGPTPL